MEKYSWNVQLKSNDNENSHFKSWENKLNKIKLISIETFLLR